VQSSTNKATQKAKSKEENSFLSQRCILVPTTTTTSATATATATMRFSSWTLKVLALMALSSFVLDRGESHVAFLVTRRRHSLGDVGWLMLVG